MVDKHSIERKVGSSPFKLTPLLDSFLRGHEGKWMGAHQLSIVTADQLGWLNGFAPTSRKQVIKYAHALCENGYLQMDSVLKRTRLRPGGGWDYKPVFYYALAKEGAKYLKAKGYPIKDSFRDSKEIGRDPSHVLHTLELNNVLASAQQLQEYSAFHRLAEFIHERDMARRGHSIMWHGQRLPVVPDALVIFHSITAEGKLRIVPLIIEHDTGSEYGEAIVRKIQAYAAIMTNHKFEEWFGIKGIRVGFTTFAGEKRREYLRRKTYELLQDMPHLRGSFLFTSQSPMPDPKHLWTETCWYTAADEKPIALLGEV